ncbi:MAG: transporter [Gammaproteobacteria bacterium]
MTRKRVGFFLYSAFFCNFNAIAATLDTMNSAEPHAQQLAATRGNASHPTLAAAPKSGLQAQAEQETEAPGRNAAPEAIGEEPEEIDTSRVFLRAEAVTLTPGQLEIELPLSYARDDLLGFRRREIAFTPTLRAGLLERLEVNVDLPLVWRENETVPRPVQRPEAKDDTAGIGDISLGLKYALLPEVGAWPNIIGLVNVFAPSGEDPNPLDAVEASTGSGRWRTFFGVSAIRSFDPAIIFGGIGYEVNFDATLNDIEVSGGNRLTYNFGAGFAVNNQLTLSGVFLGEFREELEFNGQRLAGSEIEPMSMRANVTYRAASGQFIEPSVEWGLNEDAVDTRLRISYIVRF